MEFKAQLAVLLVLVGVIGAVVADSQVLQLNHENFNSALEQHPLLVVEFYAPWCGACKKFGPSYLEVAQTMQGEATFAMMDAWDDLNKPIAEANGVSGYPTVILFKNGKNFYEYTGELSGQSLMDKIRRKIRSDYVELTSAAQIEEFKKEDRVTAIGVFSSKDSEEFRLFASVAQELKQEIRFGYFEGFQFNELLSLKNNVPSIVLFIPYGEGRIALELKEITPENLKNWILGNRFPLLDEIGRENSKSYVDCGVPLAFFFVEGEQRNELRPWIENIAKDFRNQINFVFIDWSLYGQQSVKLGLSGTTTPSLALENTKERLHYAFDEESPLNEENVRAFVESYLNGKLAPTLVSQPIPSENEGPVFDVVAKTFDSLVINNDNHVFIEFYAPWCPHCLRLTPFWTYLAELLQEIPKITFARMDVTVNDLDRKYGQVNGYPTLKLFKANEKDKPILFESGDRSLEKLLQFLKDNLSDIDFSNIVLPAEEEGEEGGEAQQQKDEL